MAHRQYKGYRARKVCLNTGGAADTVHSAPAARAPSCSVPWGAPLCRLWGSALVRRSASRSKDLRAGKEATILKAAAQRGAPNTHITTNPAAHVLQHGEAEVAQAVQLVLVGEALKVAERGDGRRELLHMGGPTASGAAA